VSLEFSPSLNYLMLALNRYFEAAKLNEKLENGEDALTCAERGLKIEEACLGKDHAQYQKSFELVQTWR
jgi:hypothetical protein